MARQVDVSAAGPARAAAEQPVCGVGLSVTALLAPTQIEHRADGDVGHTVSNGEGREPPLRSCPKSPQWGRRGPDACDVATATDWRGRAASRSRFISRHGRRLPHLHAPAAGSDATWYTGSPARSDGPVRRCASDRSALVIAFGSLPGGGERGTTVNRP